MEAPDLRPLGPSGNFSAAERAILSGRAFVVNHEFASVAQDGEVYVGLHVDADHVAVVFSVSVGNIAGNVGNSPGKATAYVGTIDSPTTITPINMNNAGPAAAGVTADYGVALTAGAVQGDSNSFNLGGQNILHGARVFGSDSDVVLGITNLSGTSVGDMTASILMAIFDSTEVEDFVL